VLCQMSSVLPVLYPEKLLGLTLFLWQKELTLTTRRTNILRRGASLPDWHGDHYLFCCESDQEQSISQRFRNRQERH